MLIKVRDLKKTIILITSLTFILLAILYPEMEESIVWLGEHVEGEKIKPSYFDAQFREDNENWGGLFTASMLVDVLIILILTGTALLIERRGFSNLIILIASLAFIILVILYPDRAERWQSIHRDWIWNQGSYSDGGIVYSSNIVFSMMLIDIIIISILTGFALLISSLKLYKRKDT